MTADSFEDLKDNEMIFAGFSGDAQSNGRCAFRVFIPYEDYRAASWPAITDSPDVVAQLKTLALGQVFKVTAEGIYSPGVRADAIEVNTDAPVYQIPKDHNGELSFPRPA